MESSHDYRGSQYSAYRGSQYSDYYGAPGTSQHPPYFNAMGGSLDFSSSDRLPLPNHQLYRTGSESSSDDIYESDNSRWTSEPQVSDATTAGCGDANESARPQSLNRGVSPNIEIPPSITSRRRSVDAIGYHTSQGQSSNFHQQEQQQQNLLSSSQEQSSLSCYPATHPNQTETVAHKIVIKDDKVGFGSGSGDVDPEDGGKTEISYDTEASI
ncbi:hypothetical protein BGZ79_005795 [Entomortierella chlamydospora]|nr:hypothetical protein BGZ79_005795 [Entomortierella chlamydospora]